MSIRSVGDVPVLPKHRLSCHCGAVVLELDLPDGIVDPRRCDCSICRRKGAIVASVPLSGIRIVQGAEHLRLYQFNIRVARHYFCSQCGIHTHHQRRSFPDQYGYNVGCLEGINPFLLGEVPVNGGIHHPADRNAGRYSLGLEIEFYFFIGSTYSYLSVTRAETLAARAGVALAWRPFSVRTLMREQDNIPFASKPVKMRYMWRDLERRAARFGVPFEGMPPYPVDPNELANHVAALAATEGWCNEFAPAIYRQWFLEKRDPGEPAALRETLASLGRDVEQCLRRAADERVRQSYAATTDRARQLGLFGSPTFVVGEEIFWGDDRLDDAIAWALAKQGPGR